MATEHINRLDSLNKGRVKLNKSIDQSNKSEVDAAGALARSMSAEQISLLSQAMSQQTQTQLDNIVIGSGTSDAETIQARGKHDLLYKRLDSSDEQLADTTEELDKKQSYEGSLVELIKKESVLKNEVVVKVVSATQIDIGVFHQVDKATVYTFRPDGDGWWRLFGAIVRPASKIEVVENYKKSVNYISTTGTWSTGSPTHYTTDVGATLTGEFEGTGFDFIHRTANNGGIWEFVIDGYITKRISTFSGTTVDSVKTLIAKGLPNGKHTVIATFLGSDPNNPPVGGTARGWANFYTGTGITLRTILPYVTSYNLETGTSVLQETSRKEFAFSIRPAGTTMSARWVPEHGNLGAMKDIGTKIMFDNVVIEDLSQETTDNYRVYQDVKFITNYNAYYTEDESVAWAGRLDQTINGQGYHNRHKFNFLADLEIVAGYPVMMAVSKAGTGNDRVVTSLGDRYVLSASTNDGSSVVLEGEPVSVAHFTSQSGFQSLKDIVIAFEVFDYKRTMRIGEEGRPATPTRVELRTDGDRKTYFGAFDYHTVRAGESYDFGWSYFIGEIYKAAEILPQ